MSLACLDERPTMTTPTPFVVHGLHCSYFTRKVTGYLDYKGLPWRMEPSFGANPAARAAGWNGGIPVVTDPDGEMIWDSTSIILHLDTRFPERAVLPDDPTLRLLAYALDDFADEWFYRHAVGTRWLYDENVVSGSWDIAREGSMEVEAPAARVREFVTEAMTGCLPRLGTTPENIEAWVTESLVPWLQTLGAHVAEHRWILGRVSLADFAFFGPNIAHFLNDPWCRRLVDDVAPEIVTYTHALARPITDPGEWFDADALPASLIAVLAEAGRHYLPWVAAATVHGAADVEFADGSVAHIPSTGFLDWARGVILARYRDARNDTLDAVLTQAGILPYYADHVDQATEVPDPRPLARPADNRPYPAGV
jgi:glutathione S-transferase